MVYQYILTEPNDIQLYVSKRERKVYTLEKERRRRYHFSQPCSIRDEVSSERPAFKWEGYPFPRSPSRIHETVRLFAVCRRINAETRPLFFALNRFALYAPGWNLRSSAAVDDWLRWVRYPTMRPRPRSLTVHLGSGQKDVAPKWPLLQRTVDKFHPSTPISMLVVALETPYIPNASSHYTYCFKFGERQHVSNSLAAALEQDRPDIWKLHLTRALEELRRWIERMPQE